MQRLIGILVFMCLGNLACGQIVLKLDPAINDQFHQVVCTLESKRNSEVSKFSDVSPHAPAGFITPGLVPGKEIWFPAIDVEITPEMVMVLQFVNVGEHDQVCWNGHITADCRPLKQVMTFENNLEHWENQVCITSEKAGISHVKIRFPVRVTNEGKIEITTLSDHWSGRVIISGYNGKNWQTLKDSLIISRGVVKKTGHIEALSEPKLNNALKATMSFLTRCQNMNPKSPYYGGLYLFYDLDEQIYRKPDWVWAYGPSIKLFLESAKRQNIVNNFGYERLLTSARLLAEASLRVQVLEESHPAYGLVECRNDPRMDSPQGAERFSSPADSYFLAGWGWIPYYLAMGDQRFLDATILMTNQIERILSYDELIEQDYLMKAGQWKNWTMDESGFGMKGAEAIVKVTGNEHFREIGKGYIEGLLKYLGRDDGLWDRTWHRNKEDHNDNGWKVGAPRGTSVLIETKYSTRGLGWAMIGLLASHGMMPEEGYLEKAVQMADHLIKHQHPDGYWPFLFKEGDPNVISVKGTTLWSLLFYELYHYTKDPGHLEVARKALLWSMNNQDMNENSPGYGGISEITVESGVVYRRWNEVICSYAMAWYGLAILEELKLRGSE